MLVIWACTAAKGTKLVVTLDNLVHREVFGKSGSAVLDNPINGDRTLDAFTICVRFQMKTLGNPQWPGRGTVMTIGDW